MLCGESLRLCNRRLSRELTEMIVVTVISEVVIFISLQVS